jgi:hypothetical protein
MNYQLPNGQLPRRARTFHLGPVVVRVIVGSWALGVGILGISACTKARAETSPDGPPLAMPAPPPRVLAPVEEPLAATPVELTEPTPTPPNPSRRTPARSNNNAPAQKPDQPPPAEPATNQTIPDPPAEPGPTLRAPGAAEKPVRDRLVAANRDLGRVDYAKLSVDGRAQYEQSKRFIQQAEDALKTQNFVFAQTLADKAATLAAELLGR